MSPFPFLVVALVSSAFVNGDEIIGFPADITSSKLPVGKLAFELPSQCNENEILYPGDQADDWVCDCKPGYIYHSTTERCVHAYHREFCREGQHVVLAKDGFSVVCKTNICQVDGRVLFNGTCVTLGAPCDQDTRKKYEVDEETSKIHCAIPYIITRNNFDDRPVEQEAADGAHHEKVMSPFTREKCLAGSKRRLRNNCDLVRG